MSFNCVAAVKVHSGLGAQENKICHCFHFSFIYMYEVVGLDAMNVEYIFVNSCLNVEF